MSLPRRRLIRTTVPSDHPSPQQQRQVHKLRDRLEHETPALARWQTRAERAFDTVAKCQKQIARIELAARLEE